MPEVISRQAVVRIFKRAQSAGLQSAHQGRHLPLRSTYFAHKSHEPLQIPADVGRSW